jgi:hypothetical protein
MQFAQNREPRMVKRRQRQEDIARLTLVLGPVSSCRKRSLSLAIDGVHVANREVTGIFHQCERHALTISEDEKFSAE